MHIHMRTLFLSFGGQIRVFRFPLESKEARGAHSLHHQISLLVYTCDDLVNECDDLVNECACDDLVNGCDDLVNDCAQDYTEMLLGRRPSGLLFDQHYQCMDLLGRGDFGMRWMS